MGTGVLEVRKDALEDRKMFFSIFPKEVLHNTGVACFNKFARLDKSFGEQMCFLCLQTMLKKVR